MKARIVKGKVIAPEVEIPIQFRSDVVVVGGGCSGIAASLAAARAGVSVTLVERYGYLGGLITGGLVLHLEGFGDGEKQVVGGIGWEVIRKLKEMDGAVIKGWDATVDPEVLKRLAFSMMKEEKIHLILHSYATRAIVEDEKVKGVVIDGKGGTVAVLGEVIVDTTGDGDIFSSAGASFRKGERGFGLPFRVYNVDLEKVERFRREKREEYNKVMEEVKKLLGFPIVGAAEVKSGFIWWSNMSSPMDGLDVKNLTNFEMEIREKIVSALKIVQRSLPGFESSYLLQTASQIGVRESRLLDGEYTLTEEDMKEGRKFEDAVAHLGYGGKPGVGYDFPYRCLVPKRIDNLLVGGRCVSTDHPAQNFIRVVANCFATGEAAGAAAALSVKEKLSPRYLDVEKLRSTLAKEGVLL
jgi:hypothetical protein